MASLFGSSSSKVTESTEAAEVQSIIDNAIISEQKLQDQIEIFENLKDEIYSRYPDSDEFSSKTLIFNEKKEQRRELNNSLKQIKDVIVSLNIELNK